MSKTVTVKLRNNIMVWDVLSGQTIEGEGEHKVKLTPYIQNKIDLGDLILVEEKKPAPAAKAKAE